MALPPINTALNASCLYCDAVFTADAEAVKMTTTNSARSKLLRHMEKDHEDRLFQCPRAATGPKKDYFGGDCLCTFCGSISPTKFFERVKAGAEVTPTDKNYKCYVDGANYLYFQHMSPEDYEVFIHLVNAGKMRLGYPGYFYVPPVFASLNTSPDRV